MLRLAHHARARRRTHARAPRAAGPIRGARTSSRRTSRPWSRSAMHVVEADARAHEHLLHAGQLPQLAQKLRRNPRWSAFNLPARLRRQGTACLRQAPRVQLLVAGRLAEVGRGAADVVDVALELRVGVIMLRLFAAMDSWLRGLDDAPLMERQRAEGALAEAAAVGGQAELHLANGRDAAGLFVGWGGTRAHRAGGTPRPSPLWSAACCGRVLHHEHMVGIGLHQAFAREGVAVAVLDVEALGAYCARLSLNARRTRAAAR